jgi:hypothetical protein
MAGMVVDVGIVLAIIYLRKKGMMPAGLFKGGQIDSLTYISLVTLLGLLGVSSLSGLSHYLEDLPPKYCEEIILRR